MLCLRAIFDAFNFDAVDRRSSTKYQRRDQRNNRKSRANSLFTNVNRSIASERNDINKKLAAAAAVAAAAAAKKHD